MAKVFESIVQRAAFGAASMVCDAVSMGMGVKESLSII